MAYPPTPAHLVAAEELFVSLTETGLAPCILANGKPDLLRDPGIRPTAEQAAALKAIGPAMREWLRWSLTCALAYQSPAGRAVSLRYLAEDGHWAPGEAEIESFRADLAQKGLL